MGTISFKNNSTLNFDEHKEAELVEQLTKLRSSTGLGNFNAACIRACWENPELFKQAGYTMEQFGMTDTRMQFFSNIEKQMLAMRLKVDKIYDMALKLYTFVQFGKRLGLEKKSEQLLQADFCVQRQIDELSHALGISNLSHVWESNKLDSTMEKADSLLEFIIESYEDVVNELVSTLSLREVHIEHSYTENQGHQKQTEYTEKPSSSILKKTVEKANETIINVPIDNSNNNATIEEDSLDISSKETQDKSKQVQEILEVDMTGAAEEIIPFGGIEFKPSAEDKDLLLGLIGQ